MPLSGGDVASRGIAYATTGLMGTLALGLNKEDYIDPYVDKYFPALATKLGVKDLDVNKGQVTIELSEEGGKLSTARVNDTEVDGNVILGGEFIYDNPNTVNNIKWFKENPTAALGDPSMDYGTITTETAPGFWGLENGKLKAGALNEFSDETIVVPIRPSTNAFKPIRQAGVTEDGGLRMITDPDQENDGLVYNNARTEGKLLFYSPKTGRSYYLYNENPGSTAAEINRLVSENEDLRYIMLDNGRYSHYKDKGTEKLTADDLKEYAAADIGKAGNPGFNIIFKRKDSKKFGGPVNFRDGGQLPKAQFGPPTAQDSAQVASKASQVGNYLVNNGYTQLNSKPANLANSNAFRQDLESGIRRFTNANNSGNIIDFRTGNRGSFPGNYTVGYTGHNPVWSQRDMASGVLNPNIPPSYYDTRILPQRFDVYDAVNQYGNYDSVGKYTYEKLAVTPWKKLTTKQRIQRLEKFGTSGSPYKDKASAIKELKAKLNPPKKEETPKQQETPVIDKPVEVKGQPEDIKEDSKTFQDSSENYTLHYSGNPGVAYLYYKKNNADGTYTQKLLGATETSKWLNDEQQKQFHSPSGGSARVKYNPDIKTYIDVKDAIDQVEKFREEQKESVKQKPKVKNIVVPPGLKYGGSLPKAQYGPPDWRNILDYKNAAPPVKQNLVGDVRKVARPTAVSESTKVPTQKLPANFKQLKEEADANAAADRRMAEDEFVAKWDQVNGLTPRIPQPGDPDWQMPYPNDPAGLPSVPIFESLLMAPVALGEAGLAGLGEMIYGAASSSPLMQATGAGVRQLLNAAPKAVPWLNAGNALTRASNFGIVKFKSFIFFFSLALRVCYCCKSC